MVGAADRLAASVARQIDFVPDEDLHVVELLYRAGGDPVRADLWRDHLARRLPDGTPLCG